jgi:hypothetical protein
VCVCVQVHLGRKEPGDVENGPIRGTLERSCNGQIGYGAHCTYCTPHFLLPPKEFGGIHSVRLLLINSKL